MERDLPNPKNRRQISDTKVAVSSIAHCLISCLVILSTSEGAATKREANSIQIQIKTCKSRLSSGSTTILGPRTLISDRIIHRNWPSYSCYLEPPNFGISDVARIKDLFFPTQFHCIVGKLYIFRCQRISFDNFAQK
jgi:hypothetical protein